MRLQGKVALVTGAARGIGLEIVRQFHLEGAEVYALDLAFDKAFPSSRELGKVRAMECDVADRTAVDKLLAEIVEEHPSIDILVNNAGVNPEPSPIEKTPLDNLETILATNLKSIFHLTSAVLPSMPKGGAIINVASILGLRGAPSCAAYTASKGGVIALSRAMAKDYAPGVRVNVISPGAIETAMFDDYLARAENPTNERKRICSEIPMQRLGKVSDVSAAAVFLASDEACWITGHNLVVDGGDSI